MIHKRTCDTYYTDLDGYNIILRDVALESDCSGYNIV